MQSRGDWRRGERGARSRQRITVAGVVIVIVVIDWIVVVISRRERADTRRCRRLIGCRRGAPAAHAEQQSHEQPAHDHALNIPRPSLRATTELRDRNFSISTQCFDDNRRDVYLRSKAVNLPMSDPKWKSLVAFTLVVWLFSVGSVARADNSDSEIAAKHYQSGMAHYRLEEYDAAISDFEAGFRVHPAPEFLFNIAQAQRLSKRPEKAVSFYQKYLYMVPNAPNRDEVERLIANLSQTINDKPVKSVPSASNRVELSAAASPIKTADRPLRKKAWFWGVIGTVGALVIAGAVTGAVVGARDTTRTVPGVQF